MGIGKNLMNKIFEEMGTGYEGNRIEKDGNKYEFKGNRRKSIHGLFGSIDYKRAYYVGINNTGGSYIPLDEKLGIRKKHTPGFNYFFSSFTGVSEIVYDKKQKEAKCKKTSYVSGIEY